MFLYCMLQDVQVDYLYKILQKFGEINSPLIKSSERKSSYAAKRVSILVKTILILMHMNM